MMKMFACNHCGKIFEIEKLAIDRGFGIMYCNNCFSDGKLKKLYPTDLYKAWDKLKEELNYYIENSSIDKYMGHFSEVWLKKLEKIENDF